MKNQGHIKIFLRKYLLHILLGVVYLALSIFVFFVDLPTTPPIAHIDFSKLSDSRTLSTTLELYYKKHGTFPVIENGCHSIEAIAENVAELFDIESMIRPDFPEYQYAVSEDGQTYVVKIPLYRHYDYSNKHYGDTFKDNLEGIIMGCDCNNENYCISDTKL